MSTRDLAPDHGDLIREAWIDHLGVGAARPDTNFFEAGGNSLLAASMMGKLSEEFDHSLPMRLLARNPTLRELSAAITAWLAVTADDGTAGRGNRSWA